MGRPTNEQKIIRQLEPQIQKRTPIATDMFLPNHSGIASHPEATANFLKLDCSNDPLTAELEGTTLKLTSVTDPGGYYCLNLPSLSAIRWGSGTTGTSRLLEQAGRLIYTCAGNRMDFLNAAGSRYSCYFSSGLFFFYDQSGIADSNRYQYSDTTGTIYLNKSTGHIKHNNDNQKYYCGAASDASLSYDGTNMVINPKEVGSGFLKIQGDIAVNSNFYVDSTGSISEYHNIPTEGRGVPPIHDYVMLTGQTATVDDTNFTNAAEGGFYRISGYIWTSQVDEASTATAVVHIKWNDGTARDLMPAAINMATADYNQFTVICWLADISSNVKYGVVVSGTVEESTFNMALTCERLA
jgi:hypothetical protein